MRWLTSLKFIKNPLCSTMTEERLNALILLFVHKDMPIDIGKIIDIFASNNLRRMLLMNPFSELPA